MNENLLSSKFIVTYTGMIMFFVGFLMDKIDANAFVAFILGLQGIYSTANTVSKFINKTSAE